ncbi:MAG TPA: hypothetical protein PKD85_00240 [Saprospiraceae bacterium]|nr:hypothetical protein [Saprospiraceae bacterium]
MKKLTKELVSNPYLYFFHHRKIQVSKYLRNLGTNFSKHKNSDHIDVRIDIMLDLDGKIYHSLDDIDPLYSDDGDENQYIAIVSALLNDKHLNYFYKELIELRFLSPNFSLFYYIDYTFLSEDLGTKKILK